jgi:hypothetical protein
MNWFKKQTLPIHIRGDGVNVTDGQSFQRRWCKCDRWPELSEEMV